MGLFIWARVEDAAPILLEIWRVKSLGVGGFIHLNRGGRIMKYTLSVLMRYFSMRGVAKG